MIGMIMHNSRFVSQFGLTKKISQIEWAAHRITAHESIQSIITAKLKIQYDTIKYKCNTIKCNTKIKLA